MYSEKIINDIKYNLGKLSWNDFEDKVFIAFKNILWLESLIQITAWAKGSWPWDWKRDFQGNDIFYTVYGQTSIWDWKDLQNKCRKDFNWIMEKVQEDNLDIKKWIFVCNRWFWDSHINNFEKYKKEVGNDIEIEYWDLNIIVSKLISINLYKHKNTLWYIWLISNILIPELIPIKSKSILDKVKKDDFKYIKWELNNIKESTNFLWKDSLSESLSEYIQWDKSNFKKEIENWDKKRKLYLLNLLILWMDWFEINPIVDEIWKRYWSQINHNFDEIELNDGFKALQKKINKIFEFTWSVNYYDNEIIKEYVLDGRHKEVGCFYEWVIDKRIDVKINNNLITLENNNNNSISDLL